MCVFGVRPLQLPQTHLLTVSGLTMHGFRATRVGVRNDTACFAACSKCKPFQGGWETRFERVVYIDSPQRATWPWEHAAMYRDVDGSLSGVLGGWVMAQSALFPPNECVFGADVWSVGTVPGAVCDGSRSYRRLAFNKVQPSSLKGKDFLFTNTHGTSRVPWREKRLTHPEGYMAVLPMNITTQWMGDVGTALLDTTYFTATLFDMAPQDSVLFHMDMFDEADHFDIGSTFVDQVCDSRPVCTCA